MCHRIKWLISPIHNTFSPCETPPPPPPPPPPWLNTHSSKAVYHRATWSSLHTPVGARQMLMYCQKLPLSFLPLLHCLFPRCIPSLALSLPPLAELTNDFDFRYCVFFIFFCGDSVTPTDPLFIRSKHNSSSFALGRSRSALFSSRYAVISN